MNSVADPCRHVGHNSSLAYSLLREASSLFDELPTELRYEILSIFLLLDRLFTVSSFSSANERKVLRREDLDDDPMLWPPMDSGSSK